MAPLRATVPFTSNRGTASCGLRPRTSRTRTRRTALTQGPLKGGYNGKTYDSKDDIFTDDDWHRVEAYFKLNTLDLVSDKPNADGVDPRLGRRQARLIDRTERGTALDRLPEDEVQPIPAHALLRSRPLAQGGRLSGSTTSSWGANRPKRGRSSRLALLSSAPTISAPEDSTPTRAAERATRSCRLSYPSPGDSTSATIADCREATPTTGSPRPRSGSRRSATSSSMRNSSAMPRTSPVCSSCCTPHRPRSRFASAARARSASRPHHPPAGPGYHQYLCGLFRRLTRGLRLRVDRGRLHRPDRLLRRAVSVPRSKSTSCAGSPKSVAQAPARSACRAHTSAYPGGSADAARPADGATGPPRSPAIPCAARTSSPGGARSLDRAFYRNRALARLWCDFPWRPPLTETEGEEADQIANDLATAFKLDPAGELPWAEWLELLAGDPDRCGRASSSASRRPTRYLSIELWKRAGPPPAPDDGPRIGYRRYPVRRTARRRLESGSAGRVR